MLSDGPARRTQRFTPLVRVSEHELRAANAVCERPCGFYLRGVRSDLFAFMSNPPIVTSSRDTNVLGRTGASCRLFLDVFISTLAFGVGVGVGVFGQLDHGLDLHASSAASQRTAVLQSSRELFVRVRRGRGGVLSSGRYPRSDCCRVIIILSKHGLRPAAVLSVRARCFFLSGKVSSAPISKICPQRESGEVLIQRSHAVPEDLDANVLRLGSLAFESNDPIVGDVSLRCRYHFIISVPQRVSAQSRFRPAADLSVSARSFFLRGEKNAVQSVAVAPIYRPRMGRDARI